jgi:hypothetical protein
MFETLFRYHSDDTVSLQDTIVFVDMSSNKTFTILKDENLEAARHSCNADILTNEQSPESTLPSTTTFPISQPTTTFGKNTAVLLSGCVGFLWILLFVTIFQLFQ